MNTQRILVLADCIRKLEYGMDEGQFSMAAWSHRIYEPPCGSPSCIAGWTLHLWGDSTIIRADEPDEWSRYAARLLELSAYVADELFVPYNDTACLQATPGQPRYISPDRAAHQLRYLAKTGEVDWGASVQETFRQTAEGA